MDLLIGGQLLFLLSYNCIVISRQMNLCSKIPMLIKNLSAGDLLISVILVCEQKSCLKPQFLSKSNTPRCQINQLKLRSFNASKFYISKVHRLQKSQPISSQRLIATGTLLASSSVSKHFV